MCVVGGRQHPQSTLPRENSYVGPKSDVTIKWARPINVQHELSKHLGTSKKKTLDGGPHFMPMAYPSDTNFFHSVVYFRWFSHLLQYKSHLLPSLRRRAPNTSRHPTLSPQTHTPPHTQTTSTEQKQHRHNDHTQLTITVSFSCGVAPKSGATTPRTGGAPLREPSWRFFGI